MQDTKIYLNRAIPTAGQITLARMTLSGCVPKCLHTPRHNVIETSIYETIIKPRMKRIYNYKKNYTNILAHLHTGPRGATHLQDNETRIQMDVSWCVCVCVCVCARARAREIEIAYVSVCIQIKACIQ